MLVFGGFCFCFTFVLWGFNQPSIGYIYFFRFVFVLSTLLVPMFLSLRSPVTFVQDKSQYWLLEEVLSSCILSCLPTPISFYIFHFSYPFFRSSFYTYSLWYIVFLLCPFSFSFSLFYCPICFCFVFTFIPLLSSVSIPLMIMVN